MRDKPKLFLKIPDWSCCRNCCCYCVLMMLSLQFGSQLKPASIRKCWLSMWAGGHPWVNTNPFGSVQSRVQALVSSPFQLNLHCKFKGVIAWKVLAAQPRFISGRAESPFHEMSISLTKVSECHSCPLIIFQIVCQIISACHIGSSSLSLHTLVHNQLAWWLSGAIN